jgi:hypothetical protein
MTTEHDKEDGQRVRTPPGLLPSVAQAEVVLKDIEKGRADSPGHTKHAKLKEYFGLGPCEWLSDLDFARKDGLYIPSVKELDLRGDDGFVRIAPLFVVRGTGTDPRTGGQCRVIQCRNDYGRIWEITIPVSVIHQGGHHLAGFLGDKGFLPRCQRSHGHSYNVFS